MVLGKYEPKQVFKFFEAISQIPRGSGNEKAVSDYISCFAKDLGLKVVQDEWNNLIIYKPATPGYENNPAVILQAHLDMVCEKNAGTEHDFEKDPLKLYVEGDIIKAKGTTLGADNGLGVALCMAVLESKEISHPALEIVLTTDEETGMTGVKNLDTTLLTATQMINLDSSEDTHFTMGCAAGSMADYILPVKWEACSQSAYNISVKGLKGGHSGGDITQDRGNALVILGHLLDAVLEHAKIVYVSGGMKVNAIPREAQATVTMNPAHAKHVAAILEELRNEFAQKHHINELQICFSPAPVTTVNKVLSTNDSRKLVASLLLLPNGVFSMSRDIEGLPNSSCNIGVLETLPDSIKISIMPRGAANYYNRHTETQILAAANLMGAKVEFSQRSPAWPYNPNSALLKTATKYYQAVFNRPPQITATHGGLECGLLADKIPGLDIISFGPNTYDIHTPEESASIKSVGRVWAFLTELLGNL